MTDNLWKPTQKQTEFLQLPYSVLEAFYAGAVSAGKSDVLIVYPIIHRLHENPNFKGLFLRRTFPELKNEIIPRSKKFFNPLGAKYSKNDHVWEFESGALFFFGHCEDEDDVHKYDSMQINYCAFDELTSFTEWQYLYLTLQRVRTTKDSVLPAICRSASNPGNIGHNWVRKRFIDPCPEGSKLIKGPSGIKRIYIPATIYDNPHADPNYIKSLEAIPDRAERDAKLHGDWNSYEGQVFEEFRDRRYPDEPENALHVIEGFEIPAWWPKINIIDWGYAALTYSLWGAISPDKRVYLYRELFWKRTKIEEWAPEIKYWNDLENPRIIKLCRSASQDRGQEHTIQQQVSNAIGREVDVTTNSPGSRIAGKALLHEYLRWKQKPILVKSIQEFDEMHAQFLLRNRSMKEYNSYLESFKPSQEETNIPKLLIFDDLKLLIQTIKACVYDKTKIEDVMEFNGDDPYDTLRYLLDDADRYFTEAEEEFNKIQKQQKIIEDLARTKDFTMYYRNSKKLESGTRTKGINRYHNAR